jgi:uncharacterized protein (DUF427 family)
MSEQHLQVVPHPVRNGGLTYDPSARWVRARIGDTTIVDSKQPLLLWEPGRPVATYLFPAADVRTDLLRSVPAPSDQEHVGAVEWYDLELDGRRFEQLAWRYDEGPLAGHIAIDWFGRKRQGVEHWYEEEEEVFVHPRDPHKRVDALPSSRHVRIAIGGKTLAETTKPVLLFETHLPIRYYIPPEDVDFSQLEETELKTRCPYKGIARYWSVSGVPSGKNIVWAYDDPIPAAGAIKGHLAFYNEVVDITVDGVALDRPVTHFNQRLENDAPDTTGVPVVDSQAS